MLVSRGSYCRSRPLKSSAGTVQASSLTGNLARLVGGRTAAVVHPRFVVEEVVEDLERGRDRAVREDLSLNIGVVLETDDRGIQRKMWLPRLAVHAGLVHRNALVALEVRTYEKQMRSHGRVG